jgi:hypothetical protein
MDFDLRSAPAPRLPEPDSAVLTVPATEAALRDDIDCVLAELQHAGVLATVGSIDVSHKPTINSNNGG